MLLVNVGMLNYIDRREGDHLCLALPSYYSIIDIKLQFWKDFEDNPEAYYKSARNDLKDQVSRKFERRCAS